MENENELKKGYLRSYLPHGHNQKDLSDYMARLDELERKLIKARYDRIDLYAEIFTDIEKLEDGSHAEWIDR